MSDDNNINDKNIKDLHILSDGSINKLIKNGYTTVGQFQNIFFPNVYKIISFDQSKILLKFLIDNNIPYEFSKPDWTEDQWHQSVETMVDDGIVSWKEISIAVCGGLNPPQVGTAIASNKSFQAKFPPRETMKNVMEWFYNQGGKCEECGTRLSLEADHIRSKQDFTESGIDPTEADTLDNLQLLCKRCNVIKRPSHGLGGISFGPAQSVLIWVLLNHKPKTKEEFYTLCRDHGLTMANIRFDEAWAFAEWLKKEGKYDC